MSAPPPAQGVRIEWAELPTRLRTRIEDWLGAPVVSAETQPGGFSPGLAARLRAANGRRLFVKAVSANPNPVAPRFHRQEVAMVRALPAAAPVPPLHWSHDEGGEGWVVLGFEDIAGRHPRQPWVATEVARVAAALTALTAALTPSPVGIDTAPPMAEAVWIRRRHWSLLAAEALPNLDGAVLDDWSRRHTGELAELELRAPAASAGETLLHSDLRADNMLLTEDRVWFVDWPHARVGAPWIDVVAMAPSVAMQGGPVPEIFASTQPSFAAADEADVNAIIAAFLGFLTWEALQPPPPGLPTLRPFQAAQAAVARAWLRERTGLR